ncbi:MAG: hypothetical protein ACLP7Q_07895 [Isosphaeraceae bacterium]
MVVKTGDAMLSVALAAVTMLATPGAVLSTPSLAQTSGPLRVRLEAAPGPYYTGGAIELTVGVAGRDQRPSIDIPRLAHAEVWPAGTSFKPISATGIGPIGISENLFVTRLVVVPRRAGTLEIPPFLVRLDRQSGRSRPLALSIEPVPLEGRPAAFLGGVGDFKLQASLTPATGRVGQEFLYRVKISGPAAWGMSARPDLSRFDRLPLAIRAESLPDETAGEPESRTFVYRLRPMKAGTAVLPPLAIAAFDPKSRHYLTKVTQGVPIIVVAVPSFDPGSLDYSPPGDDPQRELVERGVTASVLVVLSGGLALALVLRRRANARWGGQNAARRFARQMVRELRSWPASGQDESKLARKIVGGLITHAQIGTGRPPGAMTASEARAVAWQLTRSQCVAEQAALIVARCDQVLFSVQVPDQGPAPLLDDARALYRALERPAD